ncbi:MAG: CPBP family intramembrane metalloprotease [Rhodobacterales bacterium]|nr:MAG: CPBP family intramembrane metalloprotease [Rhodobacterales bacterium]
MRPATRTQLWIEFIAFYVVAPLIMAVLLPATMMFPALFGVTFVGMVLLHITTGFSWRDLLRGWAALRWGEIIRFGAVVLIASLIIMWGTAPDQMFVLIRERPEIMVMIALFYPVVSALPQEIVFRALFFRRYARILPRGTGVLFLNAALFSLAHLMYWSWIVAVMTFVGGVVFAWAYELRQSFALAVVLHSVAGVVLFCVGMGVYFFSGNVVRPF